MHNPQLNPWLFLGSNDDVGSTLEDITLTHGGQLEGDLAQGAVLETAAIPVRNRSTLQLYTLSVSG
jgi:hypothetical protein